ncbi:MAG: alpha-ribazole phosphatase [Gammaproteobacteria bacterium]|nr:alpha-ribazole phosphatase [Gammaproteobacteria bacterium]
MRVLLIRHTEVAAAEGICYGRLEVALRCGWRADVKAVAARLPWAITSDTPVLSSPSARCQRLAERLSDTYQCDERLLELNFGAWESRPWKDLPADEIERWSKDVAHFAPPGGESLAELTSRASQTLRELLENGPERAILVTHSGVIRALIAHIIGLPLAHTARLHIEFGGLCEVEINAQRRRLFSFNR